MAAHGGNSAANVDVPKLLQVHSCQPGNAAEVSGAGLMLLICTTAGSEWQWALLRDMWCICKRQSVSNAL